MAAGESPSTEPKLPCPSTSRIAHGEILRHARHGFVDGHVTVRMIFAQHFADDAGGFFVRAAGADAHVVHGIQDAPVDGLQPIAGIRQGARHDHAHGVIQISPAHLVDIDLLNGTNIHNEFLRS